MALSGCLLGLRVRGLVSLKIRVYKSLIDKNTITRIYYPFNFYHFISANKGILNLIQTLLSWTEGYSFRFSSSGFILTITTMYYFPQNEISLCNVVFHRPPS